MVAPIDERSFRPTLNVTTLVLVVDGVESVTCDESVGRGTTQTREFAQAGGIGVGKRNAAAEVTARLPRPQVRQSRAEVAA